MMVQMRQYSTKQALRLTAILTLVLLLGSSLALITRKKQSLDEMLRYHTRIKSNLIAMQDNTRRIKKQMSDFRTQLKLDEQRHSKEVQLFQRLDQIKSAVQPTEMLVTAIETKDAASSIGFTLKLPYERYEAGVNAMGQLQTESLPLVSFNEASLSSSAGNEITITGTVLLPALPGGQP